VSALVALSGAVWTWLLAELVLSGGLWAAYVLLARRLRTAADRFLFLKLSFVALLVLPWLPTILPPPAAAPWEVAAQLPAPLPERALQALSSGPQLGVASGLALLYLLWAGRCVLTLGLGALRLRRLVQGAKERELPDFGTVLLHAGELPPATVGIVRPRILLPARLYEQLDARAVQLILRHEAVHQRRRDGLFNSVVVLLRGLLAISPFVRALARHFESEMELSVDAAVLAEPDIAPREYGRLLLALATELLPRPQPGGSELFIARSLITRRIAAMTKPSSAKNRPVLAACAFAAFALLGGGGLSALNLTSSAWASAAASPAAATDAALQVFLVQPGGSHSVADDDGGSLPLAAAPVLTQADLDRATFNDGENPTLSVHLRPAAAARFSAFSGSHLGHKLAIVLEGKLLAAPVIKARIDGDSLVLSGHFPGAMRRLAATINGTASPTAPR
jgi:hypothetical protein